jgi:hypothetical protein
VSPPLFSPNEVTIALAEDGIAITLPSGKPRSMVSTEIYYHSANEILEAMQQVTKFVVIKNVRFLISNHFVRYGILAWKEDLYTKEDWLALARHDFNERLGLNSKSLVVQAHLGNFGENVITSAIDQSLVDGLTSIAKICNWNILAIEPFLMSVAKKIKNQNHWMVIAQPQKIVLCESSRGQWRRIRTLFPPRDQEYAHLTQQLSRDLSLRGDEEKPSQINAYVAPLLKKIWGKNSLFNETHISNTAKEGTSTAMWMVGF